MENKNLPQCVGFIMDGNRRFAREKGQPSLLGHKAGFDNFFTIGEAVKAAGIPHAVFYAFSTENWNRSKEEVDYLLDLFREMLRRYDKKKLEKEELRVRIIGRRKDFPEDLQIEMDRVERDSVHYTKGNVWIALSYGGRAEIVAAVNEAIKKGEAVDEKSFQDLLWSAEMPNPDLIIRTSGEKRLSNFMTWHSVYSELFFIDTYWPAFTNEEFQRILYEYANRDRRIGK